jgi:hypothetical protein
VVVAQGEAAGDIPAERSEVMPDSLADRLERLEAGSAAGSMDADALGGAVVDGDEHRDLPLAGDRGGIRRLRPGNVYGYFVSPDEKVVVFEPGTRRVARIISPPE